MTDGAAGAAATCVVTDKWTGETLAEYSVPGAARLGEILAKAEAASAVPWHPLERAAALRRTVEVLDGRRDELASTMRRETGFTQRDVADEIARACVTLLLCAEEATRLDGEVVPVAASESLSQSLALTIRVPIGVVLAMTPFNAPLNGPSHKVGPALAGGNAVVLKPSELTPMTAMMLAEVFAEAGVPPDRVQVVVGPGDVVGMPLLRDERVAFTTFTGSTKVGEIVKAATGVRPCTLELGNVSATIVCEDADLDLAIPAIVRGSFRKAGQVCTSIQRLFVRDSIYAEVVERLVESVQALRVGDPSLPDTDVGPVISGEAAERLERLIASSVADGATVAVGGTRSGSVVYPAVITDVGETASLAREEAFGPLLAVFPYSDFDDAVAGVNATRYGLQAGVFTRSIETALSAAYRLEVGGVIINGTSSTRADGMPFGGQKSSGFGKEGPRRAIREMTVERLLLFMR